MIKHIIIQAGGKGTRMGHLTFNKPKAMVSVGGEPMVIRIMRQNPKAKFYIIADYKLDILEKYLKQYAGQYDYKLIAATGEGTASGIQEALSRLPTHEPLAILWCDLYAKETFFPPEINITKNMIGLSNTFRCRWRYHNNELEEEASNKTGVAGVYVFKDKNELPAVPVSGEFCRVLKDQKVVFEPYILKAVHEVGTLEAYNELSAQMPNTRPFNKLSFVDKNKVLKEPLDSQGQKLAEREANWYEFTKKFDWQFVPRVYQTRPLIIEKIDGQSLFNYQFDHAKKEDLLSYIIDSLKQVHEAAAGPDNLDLIGNDKEAILDKTKSRLDSIADIVPYMNNDYIQINGVKCLNIYRHWNKLAEAYKPHLGTSKYRLIHGDLTFSNTMYSPATDQVYMIDPRGYYGDSELFGDPDYDWAKLYYSVKGDYDQFNAKNFRLKIDKTVDLQIHSNGWEDLADHVLEAASSEQKVRLMHAIIWLSLTTYAWDDYDSICGAFYNGIYLMQELI